MDKNKSFIINWLKEMNVNNYIINEDMTVSSKSDIILSYKNLRSIPIVFKEVFGIFDCSYNLLQNTVGMPSVVHKPLILNNNKISIFDESIKNVIGDIYIDNNPLKSFLNFPNMISGSIYARNTKVENINTLLSHFKNNLYVSYYHLDCKNMLSSKINLKDEYIKITAVELEKIKLYYKLQKEVDISEDVKRDKL